MPAAPAWPLKVLPESCPWRGLVPVPASFHGNLDDYEERVSFRNICSNETQLGENWNRVEPGCSFTETMFGQRSQSVKWNTSTLLYVAFFLERNNHFKCYFYLFLPNLANGLHLYLGQRVSIYFSIYCFAF